MIGLCEYLQGTSNVWIRVVINNELKKLKVDIATLQETCLTDMGTLKEGDYTLYGKEKPQKT